MLAQFKAEFRTHCWRAKGNLHIVRERARNSLSSTMPPEGGYNQRNVRMY